MFNRCCIRRRRQRGRDIVRHWPEQGEVEREISTEVGPLSELQIPSSGVFQVRIDTHTHTHTTCTRNTHTHTPNNTPNTIYTVVCLTRCVCVSCGAVRQRLSGSQTYQGTACEWTWEDLESRKVTPPFKPQLVSTYIYDAGCLSPYHCQLVYLLVVDTYVVVYIQRCVWLSVSLSLSFVF